MNETLAKVRVVRAPGPRGGNLVLRVEVSSDDGQTWKSLPIAEGSGGVALRSQTGRLTVAECSIAINQAFGGAVELDVEAAA